jgi:TDG/mug DNA glycosylase family protein
MARVRGFPPIGPTGARILLLGSMPSRESLRQRQYYAHSRNAFWPILGALFQHPVGSWEEKLGLIETNRIAVWDVLKACFRSSSLDSDIDNTSMEANDFSSFYADHPGIGHVFFNGAKAEAIYLRHVMPGLSPQAQLPCTRLPSTSPAHASLDLEQKTAAWRVILNEVQ